jgi:hypothetical protein
MLGLDLDGRFEVSLPIPSENELALATNEGTHLIFNQKSEFDVVSHRAEQLFGQHDRPP